MSRFFIKFENRLILDSQMLTRLGLLPQSHPSTGVQPFKSWPLPALARTDLLQRQIEKLC